MRKYCFSKKTHTGAELCIFKGVCAFAKRNSYIWYYGINGIKTTDISDT